MVLWPKMPTRSPITGNDTASPSWSTYGKNWLSKLSMTFGITELGLYTTRTVEGIFDGGLK